MKGACPMAGRMPSSRKMRVKLKKSMRKINLRNQTDQSQPRRSRLHVRLHPTRTVYTTIIYYIIGSLSLYINRWNLCLFISFIIWSSCHLQQYSIAVFLNSIKLFPIRLLMWHDKYFLSTAGFVQFIVKGIFGCVAAVACGMLYGIYLSTYHDRKFWFSTRQVGAGILWLCSSYVFWLSSHTNSERNCFLFVKGARARTHLSRRQWPLLLLLQAYADSAVVWTR